MSPRTKTVLSTVVTVVILALVIVGLWAFTAPKSSHQNVTPTITLSPAQQSQQAYLDGEKALSQNQTGTAIALFGKAVKLDPTNAAAQQALQDAQSPPPGSSSESTGSSKPTSTTPGSDPWLKRVALSHLLPSTFSDYSVGRVEKGSAFDANVSGSASKPTAKVTSIVWAVHDLETAKLARGFVTSVSKSLYTKDPATVTVNGVPGYFATDGARFATVAYVRGRYAFEVIITAVSDPAGQRALAEQAAAAFPKTIVP